MAALELNVKQSGIVNRIITKTYFKTRAGKINKRAAERYLRDDLPCGLKACDECRKYGKERLGAKNSDINSLTSSNHAVIADASVWIRFYDIFESELFGNVLITQGIWEYVKAKSISAYKKMNGLTYETPSDRFSVFMTEFHHEIYVPPEECVSESERQEKCLLSAGNYLLKHWKKTGWIPVILCGEEGERDRFRQKGFEQAYTVKEYINGLKDAKRQELLDKMAAYDSSSTTDKLIYEEHLSHDQIMQGIATGKFRRGTFSVSRENYREANVIVDEDLNTWFITGIHFNRAVHGDIVAVELLPRTEWTAPEKTIRLRDVEELTTTADAIVDELNEDDEDSEAATNADVDEGEPKAKKMKKSIAIPTAKVVGIIKRNWRPYCGILMPSALKGARRHLFCPTERVIPRIRIETEQAEILAHQRIVVCIDRWPRDSKYPLGHYVKTIGALGDRDTENEVLLLEHDVPHAPFSDAVIDCLPPEDWKPDMSNVIKQDQWKPKMTGVRVDLRELNVCSVDPLGCTDIDDALHCRETEDGYLECGVHIADVTHFVRPGMAMDDEAVMRSTTVYLCDRRIDMLPARLSSNLCSLRGNEERYAFSVIWKMTREAEIIDTRFHKSLICSKAALTYERAQEIIDDQGMTDELAQSLRRLNDMSKLLKHKRTVNGALTLASSEVRLLKNIISEEKIMTSCICQRIGRLECRGWGEMRKEPLTNKRPKIATYSWTIKCFKLFDMKFKELIIHLPFGFLQNNVNFHFFLNYRFESLKIYDYQRFWI
ncbi:hypothetical protein WR25_14205 [Diploscapter pachys]|uniref:Protein DIS3 homolog n=1 Tax=Diploscapter pachys TaxID=2018661 RepID=A0A2A2LZS2_9BILA|nr:hypothetical protein WR25_14205 [Diploscapter pachys]